MIAIHSRPRRIAASRSIRMVLSSDPERPRRRGRGAIGVRWTAPEYLRDIHRQQGADLPQFNGEESWTPPMPARYVIGQDGVIAYAEVNPEYTRRPEPSGIFPVLDKLRASHPA